MARLAVLAAIALLAAGCFGSGTGGNQPKVSGPLPASVGEVETHTGRLAGRTILVSGKFVRTLEPHAFLLGPVQQKAAGAAAPLLVLAPHPPRARKGQVVVVTGRAVVFRAKTTGKSAPFPVEAKQLRPFDAHAAVIASKVRGR